MRYTVKGANAALESPEYFSRDTKLNNTAAKPQAYYIMSLTLL